MATLGRTAFAHTKAMITGYEEEPDSPEENRALPREIVSSQEIQKE